MEVNMVLNWALDKKIMVYSTILPIHSVLYHKLQKESMNIMKRRWNKNVKILDYVVRDTVIDVESGMANGLREEIFSPVKKGKMILQYEVEAEVCGKRVKFESIDTLTILRGDLSKIDKSYFGIVHLFQDNRNKYKS